MLFRSAGTRDDTFLARIHLQGTYYSPPSGAGLSVHLTAKLYIPRANRYLGRRDVTWATISSQMIELIQFFSLGMHMF
jgi:hypothetical protein